MGTASRHMAHLLHLYSDDLPGYRYPGSGSGEKMVPFYLGPRDSSVASPAPNEADVAPSCYRSLTAKRTSIFRE